MSEKILKTKHTRFYLSSKIEEVTIQNLKYFSSYRQKINIFYN